jgi:hypothetical protein
MAHPLGLMAVNEPYVLSHQRLEGDSVVFYCNVREGAELSVLESGDIVADTARVLSDEQAEWGGISVL